MANQEQNPLHQEQPFVAAKQVSLQNTPKKKTFKCVSDFTSKCCLREPFTRSPNMYKEYLAEFWYSSKALENSKVSFFVPTGGIYGEEIIWTERALRYLYVRGMLFDILVLEETSRSCYIHYQS
ncbi:hypothetical protein Tco_1179393 [Tanacetum coccineum]